MLLHVEMIEVGGPRDKAAAITAAMNKGLAEAIEHDYHRTFLPQHFQAGAAGKYHYAKRSKKYMLRKARVKHHGRPLVWSGSLQRELAGRIRLQTLGTKSGASGRMYGRALRFSARQGMPNMKAEVLVTLPTELKIMAETARRVAKHELNQIRKMRRRKLC